MAEKKHSTLALLDILREYSDEDHILTTKQLQEHLLKSYGLNLERRTLYSNMDILEQDGIKISRYEDNGKGYYLEERQFEPGEVLLLCNAIHASHFISQNQSDAMIEKLLHTQSRYQRQDYRSNVYLPNNRKTENSELVYTIHLVSDAIREGKELEFTYLHYDVNKNLVPKRAKQYTVEPRYIVYADSRAYMIATSKHHPGFGHYRLDRMKHSHMTADNVIPLEKTDDAYEYAKNQLFMFAGPLERVQFLCHERIMDHMMDLFGTEVFVMPKDEETFTITVSASRKGAKFLAQQYLESMEILEPEDLREEFLRELEDAAKRYRTE